MGYSVFPEVLFLLAFSSVFLWLNTKFKSHGAQKTLRVVWACILVVYAAILIWAALISRDNGGERSLNLTLFSSYRIILRRYNCLDVFKQIIDNILVFVPLGILLPAAYSAKHEMKNYMFVVFAGFIMSLIIEILQYVFAIGFTEIDDLVNNTWGSMIGCGIYALSGRVESKKDSVILKSGWFKCLLPLILFVFIFGVIWCYREFLLTVM